MRLIVGLGNPGTRYEDARHNLGFMVVDELARRHDIDMGQEKFHAWVGMWDSGDTKVVLAKPTTFMNRSGQAVQAIGSFYKLELGDLLVVTDDLALPLGKLRFRARGSPGGHNGLADISQRLGTEEFARLRIGIDSPAFDAVDHVLGEFDESELPIVQAAVARAAAAATCWIEKGLVAAMNEYNPDLQDEV